MLTPGRCVTVFVTPHGPCKEMPLKLKRIAWHSHLLISVNLWFSEEPCWASFRQKLTVSVKNSETTCGFFFFGIGAGAVNGFVKSVLVL